MKNLILVGYRAVGKTTLGKPLAKELGLEFIDLDHELCRRAGQSVTEIVESEGWPGFRARERELLLELGTKSIPAVLATGGGAVLHSDIWHLLKEHGPVIWLTASSKTICSRLRAKSGADSGRPSLTGVSIEDEVMDVLSEREPLYLKVADYSCTTDMQDRNDVINEISEYYKEFVEKS